MYFKQVIFKYPVSENAIPYGGIAAYELDYNSDYSKPKSILVGVLCGECGGYIEGDDDDLEIIEVLPEWRSLDIAIQDNIRPDGTRGFRIQ